VRKEYREECIWSKYGTYMYENVILSQASMAHSYNLRYFAFRGWVPGHPRSKKGKEIL
jgi:hypothetical protein